MNKKYFAKVLIMAFFIAVGSFVFFSFAQAQYDYTPMETIPGSTKGETADLPGMVHGLYKFGIWTVGIAALFMMTVGGFLYMTSAGNTSKMDTAKGIIRDSLIGLGIALSAYLMLFIINPDLVNINISMPSLDISTRTGGGTSSTSGTGKCQPMATGPCSVENLKPYFGDNAEKASSICNAESGGSETLGSKEDKCQPGGEVVSWGLFQFNLSANNMGGLNCPKAFNKVYTGSSKQCSVTNNSLYQQCVAAAKNSDTNIKAAVSLSKGGTKWSAWGANSKCGF